MALNDWADREADGTSRPERPLPSGAIAPPAALALALALLAAGPLLAWLAAPPLALVYLVLAAAAALYDLVVRGPWSGPLLLGLCRATNLAAGVACGAVAGGIPLRERLAAPAVVAFLGAYGAYVVTLSRLGRMEDAATEPRPAAARGHLLVCAALLVVVPLARLGEPEPARLAAAVVVLLAAAGLVTEAMRAGPWTRGRVVGAMGRSLRRLLTFTASVALSAGGPSGAVVAAAILAGYPLSHALRRVFPPS